MRLSCDRSEASFSDALVALDGETAAGEIHDAPAGL
jgi:hypothetical protein